MLDKITQRLKEQHEHIRNGGRLYDRCWWCHGTLDYGNVKTVFYTCTVKHKTCLVCTKCYENLWFMSWRG